MPPRSHAPSQLNSGPATPRAPPGDEKYDSTYSSPLFSTQLQERLRQLDLRPKSAGSAAGHVDPPSSSTAAAAAATRPGGERIGDARLGDAAAPFASARGASARHALVHSIEVLATDRRKTSELAREQALAALLRILVMRYDPVILNFELMQAIIQSAMGARSATEAATALQLTCVCATLIDGSEDVRAADCFELLGQLRSSLLNRADAFSASAFGAAGAVTAKQAAATTFAVLTYFLNAGGGGYGMEVPVGQLLELAEATGDAAEAPVAAAALGGAALLLTLVSPGSAAEIATDWLYSLLPMLDASSAAARRAAIEFAAVLFEAADAPLLFQGDNADAADELIEKLESLAQESAATAHAAKRERHAQNMLVRSVLQTCRLARARAEAGGDDDVGDDDERRLAEDRQQAADLVLQYHRHALSKSLGITTWAALAVVQHLTWVLGPGLHVQLAANPYIRSLLKKEDVRVDTAAVADDGGDEVWQADAEPRAANDIARSKELRKRQRQKAESRLAEE